MWPSSPGGNNNDSNNNKNNRVSRSSSKSSSTCSSPSPTTDQSSIRRSMEEVWRDINLASLSENPYSTVTTSKTNKTQPCFSSIILQDFLARPLNKDSTTRGAFTHSSSAADTTSCAPPGSTQATALSLTSGSDFQYFGSSLSAKPNPQAHSHGNIVTPFLCSSFDASGSSSMFPSFGKKRAQESDGNFHDRRRKRMIKNRESAARSRARKQAYTHELELEVANLMAENARLKKQQEKFLAAHTQLPKKHKLCRTSTAPF